MEWYFYLKKGLTGKLWLLRHGYRTDILSKMDKMRSTQGKQLTVFVAKCWLWAFLRETWGSCGYVSTVHDAQASDWLFLGAFVFYFVIVIFFAVPYGWLDLSSPSRDWTSALFGGRGDHWTTRKFPFLFFVFLIPSWFWLSWFFRFFWFCFFFSLLSWRPLCSEKILVISSVVSLSSLKTVAEMAR